MAIYLQGWPFHLNYVTHDRLESQLNDFFRKARKNHIERVACGNDPLLPIYFC